MRWGMLVVAALAALGCGGGGEGASSTTTASTAPPTTLISFSDWQATVSATCAQHDPGIDAFVAGLPEDPSLEEAIANADALIALNQAFTAALVAIPVPDDRRVDVRQTYHLFTTTDALLVEAVDAYRRGDFAAGELRFAEYFTRFAEGEDLLGDFDVPGCAA